jgi:predicted Zn finger-like uncharacterized protein
MPIVVTCPSCSTRLKVADQSAGKMVKCPKCAAAIPVPATGGEQLAETPSAAPPAAADAASAGDASAAPKKSNKKLFIGLGIGAVLLLSCCCLGTGGGIASYFLFFSTEKNDKVTKANMKSLKNNMGLPDVEKVLGPGKQATTEDLRTANKGRFQPEIDRVISDYGTKASDGLIYRWRNVDDWIFIIFDKAPKTKDGKDVLDAKAKIGMWISNTGGAISTETTNLP